MFYDLVHIVEKGKEIFLTKVKYLAGKRKYIISLIDEDSVDSARSELELLEIQPTQTIIEKSRFEHFYPLITLDR